MPSVRVALLLVVEVELWLEVELRPSVRLALAVADAPGGAALAVTSTPTVASTLLVLSIPVVCEISEAIVEACSEDRAVEVESAWESSCELEVAIVVSNDVATPLEDS